MIFIWRYNRGRGSPRQDHRLGVIGDRDIQLGSSFGVVLGIDHTIALAAVDGRGVSVVIVTISSTAHLGFDFGFGGVGVHVVGARAG